MSQQAYTIASLLAADITQDDWDWGVLQSITDLYARGYLSARRELLGDDLSSSDPEYRDALIRVCGHNIWGEV